MPNAEKRKPGKKNATSRKSQKKTWAAEKSIMRTDERLGRRKKRGDSEKKKAMVKLLADGKRGQQGGDERTPIEKKGESEKVKRGQ